MDTIIELIKLFLIYGIFIIILIAIYILIAIIWDIIKKKYLKECPICKTLIEKEDITCKDCENKKPCPYCKEPIDKEAIKCPHCQSEIK